MREIIGQLFVAGLILTLVSIVVREYMRQQGWRELGWRGRQLARFTIEPRCLIARLRRIRSPRHVVVVR